MIKSKKSSNAIISLILAGLSTVCLGQSQGCPGILWGKNLRSLNQFSTRSSVALWSLRGGNWQRQPLQIDPVNAKGKFVFFADDKWRSQSLAWSDRVAVDPKVFGAKYEVSKSSKLPCQAIQGIEISRAGSYAYILHCPQETLPASPGIIHHDHASQTVTSPKYAYRYAPYNHLLFHELKTSSQNNGTYDQYIASGSDQFIFADLINFFNLSFGASDFNARIIAERSGPVARIGRLEFILRILTFKIDLELYPEVSFFSDAIHVPMVMHLPVNAPEYVNRGTGLYYSWVPSDAVTWLGKESSVPVMGAGIPVALQNCRNGRCAYSLKGQTGKGGFGLDFVISQGLVRKGFFPQIIWDLPAWERRHGGSVSKFASQGRIGIFFETALLGAGSHLWDFWMRFAEDMKELKGSCDTTVAPRRIIFPTPIK